MTDLITILQAAFLGVVEGLTEFLPVSSTGHLILLVDLLGFQGPPGKVFEIVIQLGAILAICWLYRAKLFKVVRTLPYDRKSQHFANAILIAFLPAMFMGVMFHKIIKELLFNPYVVSVSLILGGIAILLIERRKLPPKYDSLETIPYLVPLYIGFIQCLAMIPGVSRSGATIMGALWFRVERKTAAEFSFFLSIPTMFAAVVYDLYKNRDTLTFDGAGIIAIGFISAFITALLVVRWAIDFISRRGFGVFAWYRIALGALMLMLLQYR